jgi:hypothetical protein
MNNYADTKTCDKCGYVARGYDFICHSDVCSGKDNKQTPEYARKALFDPYNYFRFCVSPGYAIVATQAAK